MLPFTDTSDNLASKGVHEVNARRFVLVSADHPIVSAISEHAEAAEPHDRLHSNSMLCHLNTDIFSCLVFVLPGTSCRWGRSP